MPRSLPSAASSRQLRPRRKARDAEIAGVHAQQQARALVDGVAVIVECRCGWWCPLRAAPRPSAAMMSGMRKPSPISISSPRETIDFAARRQFVQRQINGRGVVVDRDGRAPQQPLEEHARVHVALAAPARAEIVFQVRIAADRLAAGPSGARPRLVCSTTPVALITRFNDGRASASSDRSTSTSIATCPAPFPARIPARRDSITRRTSSVTSARGNCFSTAVQPRQNLMHRRQFAQLFRLAHELIVPSRNMSIRCRFTLCQNVKEEPKWPRPNSPAKIRS